MSGNYYETVCKDCGKLNLIEKVEFELEEERTFGKHLSYFTLDFKFLEESIRLHNYEDARERLKSMMNETILGWTQANNSRKVRLNEIIDNGTQHIVNQGLSLDDSLDFNAILKTSMSVAYGNRLYLPKYIEAQLVTLKKYYN